MLTPRAAQPLEGWARREVTTTSDVLWSFVGVRSRREPRLRSLPVTTWYLDMRDPSELRAARRPSVDGVEVGRVRRPSPELSRSFYEHVGRDWTWVGKLETTRSQWRSRVERPGYELWIARVGSEPAGYFELEGAPGGDVEIASFGLLPGCIGKGLGGHLLTRCIRRAWDRETTRVWVHTCSLDHPHARRNYEARGLRLYDTVTTRWELPADPESLRVMPPPWLPPEEE